MIGKMEQDPRLETGIWRPAGRYLSRLPGIYLSRQPERCPWRMPAKARETTGWRTRASAATCLARSGARCRGKWTASSAPPEVWQARPEISVGTSYLWQVVAAKQIPTRAGYNH